MSTQYGTNETDIKSSPQDDQQVANIPNSDLPPKEREKWGKKVDFLLSVIGFAVDLANVWRFPHYCFKNGGGAFLVPYVIMLIIGGIPLFFMELSLGQYHRKGAITCWGRIVPLLKGVGYSTVLIALYVDFYYNVIIAWCLYFFFASWTSELPWTNCNNKWNTDQCRELYKLAQHISSNSSNISINYNTNFTTTRLDYLGMTLHNITSPEAGNEYLGNNTLTSDNFGSSIKYDSSEAVLSVANRTSPAEEYFYRSLLQLSYSSGINDLGIVRWEVALCLLAVYLICYFSMWKGISTSGKVVWFTAVFPYVVLLIMLFWSVTLPGAAKGIEYYLTPRFDNLKNIRVWVEAAAQVFFSLGPGFGVLLAYASYNEFHNNVYRDAIATSAINCLTSFLAGFVIFSVLGYMAEQANTEVSEVTNEGMGLVFVVYPEAISTMPGATFWAVIFFLMLVTLGLDSSFGGSEAIVTALTDEFPIIGRNREKFMAILFSFYYLIGIISCTQGGAYLVHLFDTFAANYSILIAVVTEAIAISWIYGINRFCDDIKEMLGFQVSIYWKICLSRVTPIVLMFIIVYGLYRESPPEYRGKAYPLWANILGWGMTLSSVLCIPGMALYKLIKTPGTLKERLKRLTTPWRDLPTVNNGVSTSLNTVQINLKHENAKDV